MNYPVAYIDYLVYFHAERDYFECHEILEEHWKTTARGPANSYWVALIQIAVALYHERRGNVKGAGRMLLNAQKLIANQKTAIKTLGLDADQLLILLKEREKQLDKTDTYTDMDLPIIDPKLLDICHDKSKERHLSWGNPSLLSNSQLIHKHTLRDRKPVIKERTDQLKLRQQRKNDPLL